MLVAGWGCIQLPRRWRECVGIRGVMDVRQDQATLRAACWKCAQSPKCLGQCGLPQAVKITVDHSINLSMRVLRCVVPQHSSLCVRNLLQPFEPLRHFRQCDLTSHCPLDMG